MSAGWVLVQTMGGEAPLVAEALARVPGVESVDQTVGAYDVVARIGDSPDSSEAASRATDAKQVMKLAQRVPGVTLAVCCDPGAAAQSAQPARSGEESEGSLPSRAGV